MITTTKMANPLSQKYGVRLSQTSPAYLHANSTSHVWVFSAIAELIDNAYDPDVQASQLLIDKKSIKDHDALIFADNGAGMNSEKLYKMLSFGYCEKVEIKGHRPVGHYGNGFKSGSMRIGKDAIVFTKHRMTMSVGFLSQTYLQAIKAETVLVPIVTWDLQTKKMLNSPDSEGSLKAITKYSLYRSTEDLMTEFEALNETTTGTRIIIYNLKKDTEDRLELDFMSDQTDIIYSEHSLLDSTATMDRAVRGGEEAEHTQSLREYASILFLKPKMKIYLRGQKVRTKFINKTLSHTEKDCYRPNWLPKPMKITFGFTTPGSNFGIMMYNKNRLIKAHEKVGYQKQPNELGVGVVGICEADFLQPTHDKQNFNIDGKYNSCMQALGRKLNEYWDAKKGQPASQVQPQTQPDWTWAQCDNCLKWRRMPTGITDKDLPDKWYCRMNRDLTHNRCDVLEEPEDEDDVLNRATYQKAPKPKGTKRIPAEAQMKMMKLERELMDNEQKSKQQEQLIQSLHHQNLVIGQKLQERSAHQLLGAVSNGAANKNGGSMPVALFRNKPAAHTSTQGGQILVTQNSSDSDSDDVKPVASKRKINRGSASSDVIMIDSDSDDDEPPAKKSSNNDVKPDVNKLNKQMAKDKDKASTSQKTGKDKKPDKEKLDKEISKKPAKAAENHAECNACGEKNAQMSDKLQEMEKKVKAMENKLKGMGNNLENLRKHVWELMQVIVPDLELENLEMVDQVVVEMVRVNKQSPGDAGEAEQRSETKEKANGKEENENEGNGTKSKGSNNKSGKSVEMGETSATVNGSVGNATVKTKDTSSTDNNDMAVDEDETQDPTAEANDQISTEDASKCNKCNGEVMPNGLETETKAEIKLEKDSQSQSLQSKVQQSDSKGTAAKGS